MRSLPYDIFRKDHFGEPVWLEAVESFEEAKRRVIDLAARTPGQYMVFCQNNQQVVSTMTSVASPAARVEHRKNGGGLEEFLTPPAGRSETVF
jgi:hypothetical protein